MNSGTEEQWKSGKEEQKNSEKDTKATSSYFMFIAFAGHQVFVTSRTEDSEQEKEH